MGRRNKGKAIKEGASSVDAMDVAANGNGGGAEAMAVESQSVVAPEPLIASIRLEGDESAVAPSDHTSSDYYFDSYAHFGEFAGVGFPLFSFYAAECPASRSVVRFRDSVQFGARDCFICLVVRIRGIWLRTF